MRTSALMLLLLFAGVLSLSAQVRPGTYSVRICETESCGATDAVASGTLVLLADTLRDAEMPDSARWAFRNETLSLEPGGHRNGCFVIQDSRMRPEYATAIKGTYWYRSPTDPDRFHFFLLRSMDAAVEVSAVVTSSGFRGVDGFWSAHPSTKSPPNVVIGEYRGPPDPSPCIAAAVSGR